MEFPLRVFYGLPSRGLSTENTFLEFQFSRRGDLLFLPLGHEVAPTTPLQSLSPLAWRLLLERGLNTYTLP